MKSEGSPVYTDLIKGHSKSIILSFFHQLLLIDAIRFIVAYIRYLYFSKIKRNLKLFDSNLKDISANTVSHNLKGLKQLSSIRSSKLIRPLSVIESLSVDARVLAIGPRNEGELLLIIGCGFMPGNVRGLDLISYSPWIDLGDMHAMPYRDDSWDVIIMGWVIAYSNNPKKAAHEVIRVAKNEAIIAVAAEYRGEADGAEGQFNTIKSVHKILSFFEGHVDKVYFNHDVSTASGQFIESNSVIFSIKK